MNKQTINNYISTLHDPEKSVLSGVPLDVWEYVQSLYDEVQPLEVIAGEILDHTDDVLEDSARNKWFKSLDKFY